MEALILIETAQQVATLAASDSKEEAQDLIRAAFPHVKHYQEEDFFPTFAIRRILAHQEQMSPHIQLVSADWATAAMVDWLAEAHDNPSHPLCQAPRNKTLNMNLFLEFQSALRSLQEVDPQTGLIFRLVYLAGWETRKMKQTLALDDSALSEACIIAEEIILAQFTALDKGWTMASLEEVGIKPPGEITRMLETIRTKDLKLWHLMESEDFRNRLARKARKDEQTILSETIERLGHVPPFVPENSKRLDGYVNTILRRQRLQYQSRRSREVPLVTHDDTGRPIDRTDDSNVREQRGRSLRPSTDWLSDVIDWGARNLRPADQAAFRGDLRKILTLLETGHPDWWSTFQQEFSDKPAAPSSLHRATIDRHKNHIKVFVRSQLKVRGWPVVDGDHLSAEERFEKLYDLLEKLIRERVGTSLDAGVRQQLLRRAIDTLQHEDPAAASIIRLCYLDEVRLPSSEIKERLGVTDLNSHKKDAQIRLVELVAKLADSKPGGIAANTLENKGGL